MATKSKELNIEDKLWKTADALRGSMDASEYRNVVLGLIFLKYVSDSFEMRHEELLKTDYPEDAEDPDMYLSENIFWVPQEARWSLIQKSAKTPQVGEIIDGAMDAIEKNNDPLRGVLNKNYSSPDLDKTRLGEVVDLISDITLVNKHSDVLGRVYEYFLNQFGKRDGEFYTPQSIVRLLVEMIEPYKGRIYDPCCGSGGMFVQSDKFVQEHQGKIGDLSVYGEESNATSWKLAKMNLAIRGIDNNLGPHQGDTFANDLHKGERFDYILANPPFNLKNWGGKKLQEDARWKYGVPPEGNANYAWIEHIISKLAPDGKAGFVLANGALSTSKNEELAIRKAILEDDKIDAIVALPSQMFYSTGIPVSLWFIDMNKESSDERSRKGETLFIDARNLGEMVDRTHRAFSSEDIKKISDTYHAYRGTNNQEYQDIAGFCKVALLDEIAKNDYVLTPGRYVGLAKQEDDGEPYEEKMARLTSELKEQFEESNKLQAQIKDVLKELGYEI
ncbi:type I restriction-modification system subunit M [Ligilactobacillus ruminis]|jgi:type I restriction enzyme M protein|uniref:site-specific DNA-methyltransferase (adenine-specific) n=1 Tax=Ligilactobacillus ruminis TaxID=1623 RepID=A0A6A8H1W2_9LACO|nr:class I SAM-dependent DNA methyltransferase [Ligilactobacillus ruminis]MSA20052.1 N-6 DNA methylase [Ligilactobacillus ruminis]MSA22126.1 N-6 DNA methylase [Ligilactobacillus ruminis]MSA24059.1 N-6 DNA methylase [Ligilactobacillus ruminis]MSA34244.1 N-6 DNA methylase [Ligilactobacillus ruminis]MSA40675.1 N-6 DNA methylase [Ligilactobacillus ruminis]